MPTNRVLVRGGTIASVDGSVGDLGDVVIEDVVIEDHVIEDHVIEPGLAVDDGSCRDPRCGDHIVILGFVDTHRHLYQDLLHGPGSNRSLFQYCVGMSGTPGPNFTADDMYLANRLGALDSGFTAVFDEADMGCGFPPIARFIEVGVTPNIGVDTRVAVGGDQFTAMSFALAVPRAQTNGVQLEAGENHWDLSSPLATACAW